jgi:molecular chaperone GrpE
MTDFADEQVLDRLAQWLRQTRAEAAEIAQADEQSTSHAVTACHEFSQSQDNGHSPSIAVSEAGGFDLYRLVEEFTALRHEVNLQTRSSRTLEDQSKTLLPALEQAMEALRSVEPKEAQAAWTAGKSLAGVLADLDEALGRGRQQTERAAAQLLDEPRDEMLAGLDAWHARQSWLARWWHGGYYRRLREHAASLPPPDQRRTLLAALADGYRLVQRRLAQSLAAEEIDRIETDGEPVDPERMIVVDIVETDEEPGGLVYEEVRPGYTWKGRLLRSAEVRATRNPDSW